MSKRKPKVRKAPRTVARTGAESVRDGSSSEPTSPFKTTSRRSTNANQTKSLHNWLLMATGFLLGALVIWAFVVPTDATSVFMGQALPQNLFWLLAACLATGVAVTGGGFQFNKKSWVFVGLLFSGLLLATFLAGEENNPRRGWHGFWQVVSFASCYFCVRVFAVSTKARAVLLSLVLAGCVASAMHGIYQVQVTFPALKQEYLADPDAVIARIPGANAPEGSPQRQRIEDRLLNSNEPYATYALTNSLAVTLSGAMLLLGSVLVTQGGQWKHNASLRIPLICTVVALLVVTCTWFLTSSRTAWAAVFVAFPLLMCAMLVRRQKMLSKKQIAVVLTLLFVLGTVCGAWLLVSDSLVVSEAGKSLGYRIQYWQSTAAMIQDHPVSGVGLGNFQSYYPQYKLPEASEEVADPHNWMLDVAATLGVPVLMLVLAWLCQMSLAVLADESNSRLDESGSGPEEQERSAATRAIALGGCVGGAVCIGLVSLLQGYDLILVGVCWLPAAALVFLMKPMLLSLADSRLLIFFGALVMMLCLLVSGSWQANGIGVPLVLLLALTNGVTSGVTDAGQASKHVRWLPAAVALLGLVCFLLQAWMPVMNAWSLSQQAQFASTPAQQIAMSMDAAKADPLDTELESWVAQGHALTALSAPGGLAVRSSSKAIEALDAWLARDSHRFNNWRQAGDLAFKMSKRLADEGEDTEDLDAKALEYYGKAVARYPNSPELRVQLAAAAFRTEEWGLFESELDEGIRLSEISPHEDKRLGRHQQSKAGDQMICFPFKIDTRLPGSAKTDGFDGSVPAEPLIEWMRNSQDNAQ